MREQSPPHDRRTAWTRRDVLAAIGAGMSTTLAGCTSTGPAPDPSPVLISSWPPETDAEAVVTRSVYHGWLSQVEPSFRERTGAKIRNWGDPIQWDVHRDTDPLSDSVIAPVIDRVPDLRNKEGPTEAIDVVDVRPGWLEMGIENDLVASLPTEQMPGWENLPDELQDGPHRQDGQLYGIPTVKILSALVYNTDVFYSAPDSWEVLWNKAHRGNVVLGGGYWDMPLIAALYTGQDPRNPTDFEAVGEALNTLREQAGSLSTPSEAFEAVTTGDAEVGLMRQSTVFQARFKRGAAVDYTVPSEGAVYKCFYHLIPKTAPNPMAALSLVNWLARPEASDPLFRREGVVPAVDANSHLPEDIMSYLRWNDQRTLHNTFPLSEELSVAYGEQLRNVF